LAIIDKFADDMQYVKKWVDENPEYLLILVSDHGGKRPSEAGAHGMNDGGNEAFMAFYVCTFIFSSLPLKSDQRRRRMVYGGNEALLRFLSSSL
jgi:hypothetical protein